MFRHYFAVLYSLLSAGARFFLGRREISTTFAHDGRKGENTPFPLLTFPSRSPITTNQKFKTCACHTSHVLGLKTPIYFSWVKARPKTSLKSCLVKVGWVGGMIMLVICPWSLGADFRHCFSTLTYLGLFPKRRSAIAGFNCMLWKADFVTSKKRYLSILYLTTHVSHFK